MSLNKKRKQGTKLGFLIFKCANSKYYKTDRSGMLGAKDMVDWQKKIEADMTNQINLL